MVSTGPTTPDTTAGNDIAEVLVVAPHPDDEALGCGGSIAAYTAAGRAVALAFLTSGERGSPTVAPEDLGLLREQEAAAAALALGVTRQRMKFLRLPDGGIAPNDLGQVGAVVALFRAVRPALLYVPHPGETSFDHRCAYELCWRAAGLCGSANFPEWGPPHWVPTVLGYEVWSAIPQPPYLHSIDEFVDRKLAAMACYSSQGEGAKGSGQATHVGPAGLALSAYRGASTVGGHREAFAVLRLGAVPL